MLAYIHFHPGMYSIIVIKAAVFNQNLWIVEIPLICMDVLLKIDTVIKRHGHSKHQAPLSCEHHSSVKYWQSDSILILSEFSWGHSSYLVKLKELQIFVIDDQHIYLNNA